MPLLARLMELLTTWHSGLGTTYLFRKGSFTYGDDVLKLLRVMGLSCKALASSSDKPWIKLASSLAQLSCWPAFQKRSPCCQ